MTKTVTVNDTNGETITLALSNKIAWLMEYRDQFGRDIVPSLMPLLLSGVDLIAGLAEKGVDLNNIKIEDVLELFESDKAMDAAIKLSTIESTDFLNIVWALNKAADDDIPEPRQWIRQFEEFPFDEVLPITVELIIKGVLSPKNQKRLTEASKKLKPAEEKKKKTNR